MANTKRGKNGGKQDKKDRGARLAQVEAGLPESACAYTRCLLNPEDYDAARSPVNPGARTAVYKAIDQYPIGTCPYSTTLAPGSPGATANLGFVADVIPTLADGIRVTAGVSSLLQEDTFNAVGACWLNLAQNVSVDDTNPFYIYEILRSRSPDNRGLLPLQGDDAAGQLAYPISGGAVVAGFLDACACYATLEPQPEASCRMQLDIYVITGTAVSLLYASIPWGAANLAGGILSNLSATTTATVNGFAFVLRSNDNYTGRLTLNFGLGGTSPSGGNPGRSWNLPNHVNHLRLYDAQSLSQLQASGAQRGAVVAQSSWVINETSELNIGGKLGALRCHGSTNPSVTNSIFNYVASAPYDSYEGAAKLGLYGFWLPDDAAAFTFQGLTVKRLGQPHQLMAGVLPSLNQQLTLRVVRVVEYVTSSQLYDQLVPVPCPQMMDLIVYLRDVECWMENPLHKKIIDKIVQTAKNPAFWKKAGRLLVTGLGALL